MTEPAEDRDLERRSSQHWTSQPVVRSEWSEPLAAVLTVKIAVGLADPVTALAALDRAVELLAGMRPAVEAAAARSLARRRG